MPYLVLALVVVIGQVSGGCGKQPKKPSLTKLEHLIDAGKLDEAEALCRETIKEDPSDYEARGSLAKVLCLQGDAELVKAGFYSREARNRPDDKRVPITDPMYASARKLFDSALAEAREALRMNPENGRIRGTLGLALHRTGQSQQAIEELKKALATLKDQPGAAEVNNTLGLISYELGRTGEALSYYQMAQAIDNTMPETCYNLAVLYEEEFVRSGKSETREAAVRYYQLYLRYSRGSRDAEVQEAIRELEGKGPGQAGAGGGDAPVEGGQGK